MSEAIRPSDLVRDDLPDDSTELGRVSIDEIEDALKDVVDPELMINVVDLGLIYGLTLSDDDDLTIDMTLTSPTCPLTDRLEMDIETVMEGLVKSVTINWVWLPQWSVDNITEDGREQLRAVGYNV